VTGKLVKHFQFSTLKDWQMKSIQATIEGRNTIIIQPTGSGKSLCFQLPPLITGRTTIVITPTISLMQDQTASLTEKGIKASYLGSTQKDPHIITLLKEGALDVAFVTVERFFARGGVDTLFSRMVVEEKIGLVAIDEAHLISSWKYFRY
jgi:ATP-dependent DNA helicase RecQ